MISLRLKTIASFVETSDRLIDIGCDHAYLAIHLLKNHLCQKVLATDIHEKALMCAKKNIEKEHLENKISLILSDGLEKIDQKNWDTVVMAGMGTNTILHILNNIQKKYIKKIIIQSNHDLYTLRRKMPNYGYYLEREEVVFEKKHYYVIGVYNLKKSKLSSRELLFGLYNLKNKEYYSYLKKELEKINCKISYINLKEKFSVLRKLYLLKKYL